MEIITHSNIQETTGYTALFGNQIRGRKKPEDMSIQKFWRMAVSFSKRNGDVSLYKDGILIRSCWNANRTILGTGKFKTYYKKYSL